jgi:Ca-activated chloride channel family protein
MLRTEDFNDDTKDAGEIGAGHTVTALYEVIPAGKQLGVPIIIIDELKYQQPAGGSAEPRPQPPTTAASGELLTLKMRYKQPEGDESHKLEWAITDDGKAFGAASDDFRFAAAVASFGLVLRNSEYRGDASYDAVAEITQSSLGEDAGGNRAEFVDLVRRAKEFQPDR